MITHIINRLADIAVAINRLYDAVSELTIAVEHIGELIRNGHFKPIPNKAKESV